MDYNWYKVAVSTEELKNLIPLNKVSPFQAGKKSIAILRKDDDFFAFQSKCPHAGGPLEAATCDDDGIIVCPWHRFKFDPETGRNTSGEGYYINTYP